MIDQSISRAESRLNNLLDPVDRFSEILFGLIMALTFTCAISVAETDRTEMKDLLIAALSCNIAWGIVDGVMYILSVMAVRGHGKSILDFIRNSKDDAKAREYIAGELPPVLVSVLKPENLEDMRKALLSLPEASVSSKLTWQDFKSAGLVFLLVFLSTLPVAIPFIFIKDVGVALRVSNLVAISFMFICGWLLAKYGGYNKWLTGISMTLLGAALVFLTIALGG